METTLFRINFKDGREFRVFCANKAQKDRFRTTLNKAMKSEPNLKVEEIINGIHTIKQWEQIVETL